MNRAREEQFGKEPDECDHETTTIKIRSGINTERCLDCGKSWTPPRD